MLDLDVLAEGVLFSNLTWLVGYLSVCWFDSWITQKILSGFPLNLDEG